jgi:hypothetical protein
LLPILTLSHCLCPPTTASSKRGGLPSVTMGWRLGRKRAPVPSPAAAEKVISDWKRATTKAEKKMRAGTVASAGASPRSGWEKPGRGGRTGARRGDYAVAHVPSQKTIDEDAEVGLMCLMMCPIVRLLCMLWGTCGVL